MNHDSGVFFDIANDIKTSFDCVYSLAVIRKVKKCHLSHEKGPSANNRVFQFRVSVLALMTVILQLIQQELAHPMNKSEYFRCCNNNNSV